MDQKKIGLFLKELRREKGLTQEQLAEVLGVTNRSVSRWENGINMPDFDLLINLARYYEVGIDELLEGERMGETPDAKTEEAMLKAADYSSSGFMVISQRLNLVFLAAVAAFIVYGVLDTMGLTTTGVYEDIASFALGLVFGVLLIGALFTSRHYARIRAFKQRLLKRDRKGTNSGAQ